MPVQCIMTYCHTHWILSRNSTQASWTCRTRGETRIDRPSYTGPSTNAGKEIWEWEVLAIYKRKYSAFLATQIGSDRYISIYLAHNGLVPPDMPVGTRCTPLTTGSHLKWECGGGKEEISKIGLIMSSHIKLADCSTRLVHPWEGQRLGPKLLG